MPAHSGTAPATPPTSESRARPASVAASVRRRESHTDHAYAATADRAPPGRTSRAGSAEFAAGASDPVLLALIGRYSWGDCTSSGEHQTVNIILRPGISVSLR